MTIDDKALQKADEHFHLITGHSIAWSANVPRKIIEAYLSALPPSPATAEGWKKVPKEPTPEMIAAAEAAVQEAECGTWGCCAEGIAYAAMIAAAPATPAQEV